jgi:hypothetical protein
MIDEKNMETEITVDLKNLYRDETFTDMNIASVRRLKPIKPDGTFDKSRKTLYIGQASIMSDSGPLPISAVISANNLKQAFKRFPETLTAEIEKIKGELKKYQKEQESSIVTPESREESGIIIPGR